VPAMVGGLTIVGEERGVLRHVRLAPPKGLSVALCVPDIEVETAAARRILPDQVSHADAAFTAGRMAFLMAGLLEGRPDALLLGVQDRLHQAWRAPLIGPVDEALGLAVALGGMGGFISGSGSTLACFVPDGVDADAVADAMCGPFRAMGIGAIGHTVRPLARGALIS
jgi:homoserine kinase